MNLSRQIDSHTSQLNQLASRSNSSEFGAGDRYEVMAYAHNQYFPPPNNGKSEQEWLDEQREKLGLKKGAQKRRGDIQEKDAEPRYEISKIKALAENDLD